MRRKRICLVCADPSTFDAFLLPHALRLGRDHDVSVVCNGRPRAIDRAGGTCFLSVVIEREISLARDLQALFRLVRVFHRERFDLVHSFTPKAGLLAMVAARIAGVPLRLHTLMGQVWVTKHGLARGLLKALDRVTVGCATHVLADGKSQVAFLEAEGVVRSGIVSVVGDGSMRGVDFSRFKPDAVARAAVRAELSMGDDTFVVLFLGRWTRDKGVLDLAAAVASMKTLRRICLVLVGPDEGKLEPKLRELLRDRVADVRWIGPTTEPERYMAAADVLCLPSYREGLPNVVIEAAACGCPCVASRIYGVTDAVEEGHGGLLHPAGDVAALRRCLEQLADDSALVARMGRDARARVEKLFPEQRITEGLAAFYHAL